MGKGGGINPPGGLPIEVRESALENDLVQDLQEVGELEGLA